MQKHHIINYNKQSIQLLIKKNKLSKSYKLTFDKKNLRGLVIQESVSMTLSAKVTQSEISLSS